MTPIALFPTAGLDQSALTPVLLGVIASWALTEWFGWVFAGLVVPGYLASVAVVHPASAAVTVVEIILTYGIARVLGEVLPVSGVASRVFGRERFLLIVLVSVIVRVGLEVVVLPALAPRATWAFSIGLVIVPLAANACWKTGLARGAMQLAVPCLIVWALLRFLLLPYTNLSMGAFALATENVAATFEATPRAYIVLLAGAVLASVANVRWGWDYNGILVPALLALAVTDPSRLLSTAAEAIVVVVLGTLAQRVVRAEGPRKLTLFFGIDYALRFGISHVLDRTLPGAEIAGLLGFGYLVPTLLAVKIAQRGSIGLVLVPAVEVAVAALGVGTTIGFVAYAFDRASTAEAPQDDTPPSTTTADPAVIAARAAVGALHDVRMTALDVNVGLAARQARSVGGAVVSTLGDLIVARERPPPGGAACGAPTVIARTDRPDGPVLIASADPAVAAAAAELVGRGLARAVVIAGGGDRARRAARLAAETLGSPADVVVVARGDSSRWFGGEREWLGALLGALGPETERQADLSGAPRLELSGPTLAGVLDSQNVTANHATESDALLALEGLDADPQRVAEADEVAALRSLVIAPLLAHSALPPPEVEALGRRVARASGLLWMQIPASQSIMVRPERHGLAFAAIVRGRGDGPVVAENVLSDVGLRDATFRLGTSLNARAIAVAGASPDLTPLLAELYRQATPSAGVVFVERAEHAGVAPWADPFGQLRQPVGAAVSNLGVEPRVHVASAHARSLATHAFPALVPGALVALDENAIRSAALTSVREARRSLRVPFVDAPPCSVAREMRAQVRSGGELLSDGAELVRRVARDRSPRARAALDRALATGAARAAIARDSDDAWLVVGFRGPSGIRVAAERTSARTFSSPLACPDQAP